eukprot:s4425_g4.t1
MPKQHSSAGGGEEYEIRFVDNQEREQIAQQWLTLASEEERKILEQKVLPFRSTAYFTGKSRLCLGAFIGPNCQGLGLTEVRMDIQDLASFFMDKRVLRVMTLITKPKAAVELELMVLLVLVGSIDSIDLVVVDTRIVVEKVVFSVWQVDLFSSVYFSL